MDIYKAMNIGLGASALFTSLEVGVKYVFNRFNEGNFNHSVVSPIFSKNTIMLPLASFLGMYLSSKAAVTIGEGSSIRCTKIC